MILLVVDTQKLITTKEIYHFDQFVSNVKTLIATARQNRIEVIYVRHDDGIGEELTKGKPGYEIYEAFAPRNDEKIYDKTVNSAFRDTGLLDYLKEKEEKQIIIVGLMTDFCIDATIKCGFEHHFEMIVPENSNSTLDNRLMKKELTYQYYNELIWKNRYARCISMQETLDFMKRTH